MKEDSHVDHQIYLAKRISSGKKVRKKKKCLILSSSPAMYIKSKLVNLINFVYNLKFLTAIFVFSCPNLVLRSDFI